MPHVNLWVRKSDLKKWEAIINKPDWVHEVLAARAVPQPSKPLPQPVEIPAKR